MKTDELLLNSPFDGHTLLRMYYSIAPSGCRTYRAHHHTACEISVIMSGSCQWQIRNRSIWCTQGDVLIFGSDEDHYITEIATGTPFKVQNLQFEPRFIWSTGNSLFDSRYLHIFLNHQENFQNRLGADTKIAQQSVDLLEEIWTECLTQAPEYELIVKAKLMQLLGYLGRHHASLLNNATTRKNAHLQEVEAALNYIDTHLTEDLALDDIVRAVGLSKSYFSEVFRELNGITAWDYITRKRIELSMEYFQNSGLPITEIAILCGFNTLPNFNRSFKRISGITPRQFRNENRK